MRLLGVGALAVIRLGIVGVGQDEPVTKLLPQIEERLARVDKVEVAVTISPAKAAAPTAAPTWSKQKKAQTALNGARTAYYDDELVKALDQLKTVAAHQGDSAVVPIAKRVELYLWQAAVHLALQNSVGAGESALAALALSPRLQVNRRVFPPSLKRLVEEVRGTGIPEATVIVQGVPGGVQIQVDERDVDARFSVPLGRHYLRAGNAVRTFDVTGDMSLTVTVEVRKAAAKPKLDDATMAALKKIVEQGRANEKTLKRTVEKLKVDALVIVVAQRVAAMERRAFVWQPGSPGLVSLSYPRTPDGEATLLFWIEREVKNLKPGKVDIPRRPPGPRSLVIRGQAGGLFMQRQRNLQGGGGLDARFNGAGGRAVFNGEWGWLQGETDLRIVSYGFSTLQTNLADGTLSTVNGGFSTWFRAGAGAQYKVGELLVLKGSVGGTWDVHRSDDFFDNSGNLFLLTSYSWLALDLRARATLHLFNRIEISASGGVSPFSVFTEDPVGATGANPSTSPGFDWEAGVAVNVLDRWTVHASYMGSARSVQFEGQADAPVAPAIINAKISENYQGGSLSIRRRF